MKKRAQPTGSLLLVAVVTALGLLSAATSDASCLRDGPRWAEPLEVRVTAGGIHHAELSLHNPCGTARTYRIDKKGLSWLSDLEGGSEVVLAPGETRSVGLTFDATGRSPGKGKGVLKVRCIDCKQAPKCHVHTLKHKVRATVTAPTDVPDPRVAVASPGPPPGAPDPLRPVAPSAGPHGTPDTPHNEETVTAPVELPLLEERLREVRDRFQAARANATTRLRVAGLIARTDRELRRAFLEADPEGQWAALEDWMYDQLYQGSCNLRLENEGVACQAAPAGVEIASLGAFERMGAVGVTFAGVGAALRGSGTAGAGGTDSGSMKGFLDRVWSAFTKVIDLVDRNDLVVDLWVASAPQQDAVFKLFRLGVDESEKQRPTDGTLEKVHRGLYRYRIEPPEGEPFEARLDLVRDGPRLCCRLDKGLCYPSAMTEACHVTPSH